MKFIKLLLALFTLQTEALSQESFDEVYAKISRHYFDSISIYQAPLYVGEIDPLIVRSRTSNPFFKSPSWQDGSIKFGDAFYKNISFLYDLEDQKLILRQADITKKGGIIMNTSKVKWFTIGGGFFRRSTYDDQDRFFQVTIDGTHFNLLRYRKKVAEASSSGMVYSLKTDYFLEYKDRLHPIRNKSDLKKLFPNYNKINQAVKSENKKLKYSKFKKEQFTEYMKLFDEKVQE